MARKLGECLIDRGLLLDAQLDVALDAQRQCGGGLGTHLLLLGMIDEDSLGAALAEAYGVPAASRADLEGAPPEVIALLSPEYARRHRALPFRIEGDRLLLAMQVPSERLAVDEAAFLTGFSVIPHVAPEMVVRAAIAHHHHLPPMRLPDHPEAIRAAARAAAPSRPEAAPEPPVAARETGAASAGGTATVTAATITDAVAVRPALVSAPPVATAIVAAPAPASPPAPALPDIGRRLSHASDKDSVVAIAADALARYLPRSLVFAVRGPEAVVVESRGVELPGSIRVALPVAVRSVITPALEGRLVFGPVELAPANQDLYTLLGGRLPVSALVMPVVVRGRTVMVLYADDPAGNRELPDFEQIKRLGSLVACAVEVAILKAKILRESGA